MSPCEQRSRLSSFRFRFGSTSIGTAAILLLVSVPVYSIDLGVQASTWPIIEIDIRELLIQSAARADWNSVRDQVSRSAQHYLDNLPRRATSTVSQTRTRWLDPSFSLDQDIRAPIQDAQGEWHWQVLYKKGMRFNPLSVQRPHSAMFFFDGAVQDQIRLATQLVARHPAKLMLVEASGINPEPIAKKLHTPIYTTGAALAERFQIQATPALLFPGDGQEALMLGLTEFAAPYSTAQVEQVWSALRSASTGDPH
jgi:conjugal transfer pilus assembly protein TraW